MGQPARAPSEGASPGAASDGPDGASGVLSSPPEATVPAPLPPELVVWVADWTAAAGATSPTSGKWQATNWPSATSRICGCSAAQRSWARGQRVRNRHPLGGSSGDGRSPGTRPLDSVVTLGSGTGIDDSSADV